MSIRLHIDRVVIVQPSIYGVDNSCTLDALRQLGARSRGVAVIDEKTPVLFHSGGNYKYLVMPLL